MSVLAIAAAGVTEPGLQADSLYVVEIKSSVLSPLW
jgi:hypothetical protein